MADSPHSPTPPPPPHESPRKARPQPYMYSGLTQEDARSEIRKDLETNLVGCSVEAWLKAYAPSHQPWNGGDATASKFIDDVANELRAGSDKVLDPKGWKPINQARHHNKSENETYSVIADLAKAICEAAKVVDANLQSTIVFDASPQSLNSSDVTGYRFYPDGRGITSPSLPTGPPPTTPALRRSPRVATGPPSDTAPLSRENADTAVISEYKLRNGPQDKQDDDLKMNGAATELMYNDPRRRHVMGFTIERDEMRLWYFGRGHVCVSNGFDFQKETTFFIRFFLSILFATIAELGYDPTITRRLVQSEGRDVIAYQYKVEDSYYLTQGHPLSEDAAYHLVSRATRVWKVKKMVMDAAGEWTNELGDDMYVLKDVWLYDDARLESDIRTDIFDALKAKDKANGTTYAKDAEPYFMSFKHDWKVVSDDLPLGDCSAQLPDGMQPSVFNKRGQVLARSHHSAQRIPSIDTLSRAQAPKPPTPPLRYQPRRHVRTVFSEVCQTLYHIKDYKTVLQFLIGIVEALRYMRLAGFVHRDISGGNCLWYGPSRQAKISDLEYARRFSELSGHDPRTGTPAFMAVEYQLRTHYFVPLPSSASFEAPTFQMPTLQPPFFTFNYYHDVESVCWLYTWFLHHYPPADLTLVDEHKEILAKSAHDCLYCDIGGSSTRQQVVIRDNGDTLLMQTLIPVYTLGFNALLGGLRTFNIIQSAYKALQATQPVCDPNGEPRHWDDNNFHDQVYNDVQNVFRNLGGHVEGDITVQRLYASSRAPKRNAPNQSGGSQGKKAKQSH